VKAYFGVVVDVEGFAATTSWMLAMLKGRGFLFQMLLTFAWVW
jgi:hypothetical protein